MCRAATVSRCAGGGQGIAPSGERSEARRPDATRSRFARAARAREFLADLRRGGKTRLYGGRARHRARAALFRRRHVRPVYRSPHLVPFLRSNDAVLQLHVPRRVRPLSQTTCGLHGSGLQLGALLVRPDERRVGETRRSRSAHVQKKTDRVSQGRAHLFSRRGL